MKVIKVINNNNLCVTDDNGREQIVSGKGIGFGKKYGDMVDPDQIQKTYLITDSELQKKMITMLKEIPSEYMIFTNDIVEYIKEIYPHTLNESLLVTLSDHIAFFYNMIKKTCGEHFKCAKCIKEYILKTYKKDINDDELVTLTIHLKKISS